MNEIFSLFHFVVIIPLQYTWQSGTDTRRANHTDQKDKLFALSDAKSRSNILSNIHVGPVGRFGWFGWLVGPLVG